MARTAARKIFGLTGVGNALVDVLAYTDEAFIMAQESRGMKKGAMMLVDAARARELYDIIGPTQEMSGGSVANTVSGFASFGGRAAFIGKTGDDQFGTVFRHDMNAQGVRFSTSPERGKDTGRSYILVTPDGERTMNTHLGANEHFGPDDIDEKMIAASKIILLEGYLYDRPGAKAAFEKAVAIAKKAGTKVAFTLSDYRCVERHHDDFTRLVRDHVDILIGNQREIRAFTLQNDFEKACEAVRPLCETIVLTRGAKGARILRDGETHDIAPAPREKLVDTTGAGDAFAAGVLFGLSKNLPPQKCGELGAKAAAKTISHIGARSPGVKFSDLLHK